MAIKFKLTILIICYVFVAKASPVKFYSVNSLYGISMRETNSVCKDDNGFVWASSKTGILRLSKDTYHTYQLPYESADVIRVRLIYKDLQLFAYTNNGQVFYYNSVMDQFQLLLNLRNQIGDYNLILFDMLIDDTGTCWISTSLGLYKYQSGELSPAYEFSSNRVAINWYDSKNLIVAKQDGIWLVDIQSLEKTHRYQKKNQNAFDIISLYLDKDQDQLWLGTVADGLYLYNFRSGILSDQINQILPKQPILDIEQNSDSTCLVGFDGQGIWELDRRNLKVLNIYKESLDVPYSLSGNGVYDLFCDIDKRVWVCTYSGGLSYLDQASPLVNQIVHFSNNPNSLVNNNVNSIVEDRWGKLWFATNNGISCWDLATNQWRSFYNDKKTHAQVFLSLCEDNQGRIWAGTYSSGVYLLDGKTGKELAHYTKNEKGSPLLNDFIFNIFKDSKDDIWLGGGSGSVVCYLSAENKFRSYADAPIGCFAQFSDNQMLLGCSYGLSLLNKQTGQSRRLIEGLLVRDVLVMGEDVWICTSGDGLIRYNYMSGETEKLTVQMGLPSNFINSIGYANDYLWVGTENGLCRIDPKDKSVLTYSSIYSLSRTSYNIGAQCQLKNGQLAWGTNNGAVIFAPYLVDEPSAKGKLFFQDLTLSGSSIRDLPSFKLNTPIDNLQEINLPFSTTMSLHLLSLGQTPGSKFSWRMEGFDSQWSQPSGINVVTYTNIPSGHFTLHIRLFDSSLGKILDERFIKINSIPPFWRTDWFWALVIIGLAGIILLFFLYYINRLKQEHTEEKLRFFTNTAHELRTSLTLIKAPVEELSKERNLTESGAYYLHLAIDQARQLSSVVTQLMDFQKVDIGKEHLSLSMTELVELVSHRKSLLDAYAKSKNIELLFGADRERYTTAVDESKMEKIVDNLISNAIKYAHPHSQILIDLSCDDKKWVLQVKDSGIGITKRAQRQLFKEFYRADNAINSKVVGSGIGLLLVKKYVSMHKGSISCSSQENVGSTFQVRIPYQSISRKSVATHAMMDLPIDQSPVKNEFEHRDPEPGTHASKEMKLLIVEDNDELLNFMKNVLSVDFKITTATDGKKAWDLISKNMPDLVISDIMMPQMDGFELCKIMKSTYETSHIPLVLLTALSETTHQLHGLGLGADDYLTKPFDMNLLIQRIRSIIRNREAVREKALKLIKGDPGQPILTNQLNDQFIKKMLEVATANISIAEFDKDAFASAMNVSSSLLYKKVKSLTDQSPSDWLKNIRLNHAVELLQSRKYTVTEVSELCGFASLTYFGIAFRKQFGKAPSEIFK